MRAPAAAMICTIASAISDWAPRSSVMPIMPVKAAATEIVAPGSAELAAAQPFRIGGGKHLPDRSVRPDELALAGIPLRPKARSAHRQESAFALHHHGACIGIGLADDRDPPRRISGIVTVPRNKA